MSVRTVKLLNDRIAQVLNPIFAPASVMLRPGKFKADCADDIDAAGIYIYMPNLSDEIPSVHTDGLRVLLHHRRFDVLANAVTALLEDLEKGHALGIYEKLNGEDDYTNPIEPGVPTLYNAGLLEGIKFLSLSATSDRIELKEFIDGSDYYAVSTDIVYQYVEGDLS